MKKRVISMLLVFILVTTGFYGCGNKTKTNSLDLSLREDYYEYVNKDLLENIEIPKDEKEWSYFYDLAQRAYDNLNLILDEIVENKSNHAKGSKEQKIADFYLTAMDASGRDEAGLNSIKPYIELVQNAKDIKEYLNAIGVISKELMSTSLFSIWPHASMVDSSKYEDYLTSADLVLGKETLEDGKQKAVWKRYKEYIKNVMVNAGYSDTEAVNAAENIFNLQKDIASVTLPIEDAGNPDKINNVFTLDELNSLLSNGNIYDFISFAKFDVKKNIVVTEPEQIKKINEYLTSEKLEQLKEYSIFILLNDMAKVLNKELADEYYEFNNFLDGVDTSKTDEKLARELTQKIFQVEFGQLYVERYFSEKSKTDVEKITKDIMKFYETRIDSLSWMDVETKVEAKKKLATMKLKIGYPEKWTEVYSTAKILGVDEGGSLAANYKELLLAESKYTYERSEKPVDKSEWFLMPQVVNAYYNPAGNEIVFPAAILQAPYYDSKASYESNLGGIGMVIAHEITHAFDNNGGKFDEYGNYSNWWSEKDIKKFDELSVEIVEYYNGYEGYDGIYVDGKRTLGENIADLGAINCVTALVGKDSEKLKDLFQNYGRIWAFKSTGESMKKRLNTDVHSPSKVRVNAVLSSTEAFYRAYPEVKEGDAMYVAPEDRVKIW